MEYIVILSCGGIKISSLKNLVEVIQKLKDLSDKGITFINSLDEEKFVSYKELYIKAQRILYNLQQRGIKPYQELVFQVEDNEVFIKLFWACILGGIIPVPLTVGKTDEHRKKLFNVWNILSFPYLVTDFKTFEGVKKSADSLKMSDTLDKIQIRVLFEEEILDGECGGTLRNPDKDDIAFIQFSSGSTGDPKGVVLTHENLICNTIALNKALGISPAGSALSWMPLTHDMGLIGVHLASAVEGISQFIIPTHLFVRQPTLWMKKVHEHRATQLYSPNFGYNHFLTFFEPDIANDWDLSCIHFIANGAEPISAALCKRFADELAPYGFNRNAIKTVYGLAEASVAVTIPPEGEEIICVHLDRRYLNIGEAVVELVDDKDKNCLTFVDVGYPIDFCHVRICDEENRVLKDRHIGYIQIKGGNVTSGYYRNRKATENAIGRDQWLNTGDLGFMQNGRLVITGRAKDIIFVNGQNIYPHDIERVIEEEGIGLGKVVVCGAFSDREQKEKVVVFVLFKKSLEEFIHYIAFIKDVVSIKTGLVVEEVIPIRKIPKTTSGKVQRYKLVERYQDGEFETIVHKLGELSKSSSLQVETCGFEDEVECRVRDICCKVLGINILHRNDSLLNLGADSLKIASILSLIHKEFNVIIQSRTIFELNTISNISTYIRESRKDEFIPIGNVGDREFYPVPSAQKRLLAINGFECVGIAYNLPVVMRIDGDLCKIRFENAFSKLVKKHEVLRTSFDVRDGEPVLIIQTNIDCKVNFIQCEQADLENVIKSLVKPFDLKTAPLVRATVITVSQYRHMFLLDVHHIIADGTSIGILIRDLTDFYDGKELEELKTQFSDYSVWQCDMEESPVLRKQEEFWIKKFSGRIPLLNLKTDYPRPVVQSFDGENVYFGSGVELAEKLKSTAKKYGATLFMMLLASYNILLHKYTADNDIVIGCGIAARPHPDVEKMVGMFVNMLPIKNNIMMSESIDSFIEKVKLGTLEAFDNQDYPFDKLVNSLNISRDPGRNPLFDVAMVLHNMDISVVNTKELRIEPKDFDFNISKFDITLYAMETNGGINFVFEYCKNLFKRDTIEKMSKDFLKVIELVVKEQQNKIEDIELFDQLEKDEILDIINKNRKDIQINIEL